MARMIRQKQFWVENNAAWRVQKIIAKALKTDKFIDF